MWMIQALDDKTCSNPSGMVIAYVDDIIAVGEQDQFDGMKPEPDKLYVMKTSGLIPSKYDPECSDTQGKRLSSGQLVLETVHE